MTQERRRTDRFTVPNRIFVRLGSNVYQVGRIIDIGLNGLSYEFISDEKAPEEVAEADIFTLDDGFLFSGLPCSVVYQIAESLPGQEEGALKAFMKIRCGIHFHDLQEEQHSKLSGLLKNLPAGFMPAKDCNN